MTSTEDWKNNFAQVTGFHSDYYENAVGIGNAIGDSGQASGVHMTGHSLGGGMASAASSASGSNGTTFNSAGLNSSTVEMSIFINEELVLREGDVHYRRPIACLDCALCC